MAHDARSIAGREVHIMTGAGDGTAWASTGTALLVAPRFHGELMNYVTAAGLLVAAVIHLLPVSGVAGAGTLSRLYGIDVADPNTGILLQHRALMFGILGALMLAAIPWPSLRLAALLVGLASAASFMVVALGVGGYNDAIRRVVVADGVATVSLALALVAHLMASGTRVP
jgi:hypothetical protein